MHLNFAEHCNRQHVKTLNNKSHDKFHFKPVDREIQLLNLSTKKHNI